MYIFKPTQLCGHLSLLFKKLSPLVYGLERLLNFDCFKNMKFYLRAFGCELSGFQTVTVTKYLQIRQFKLKTCIFFACPIQRAKFYSKFQRHLVAKNVSILIIHLWNTEPHFILSIPVKTAYDYHQYFVCY